MLPLFAVAAMEPSAGDLSSLASALAAHIASFGAGEAGLSESAGSGRTIAPIIAPGDYYLEVFLNGQPKRQVMRFRHDGSNLFASSCDLETIGIQVPCDGSGREVRLSDLAPAGVDVGFDIANLQIRFQVQDSARVRQLFSGRTPRGDLDLTPSATGALLNYSVVAVKDDVAHWSGDAGASVSASLDARFFSRFGSLSHGLSVTEDGVTRLQTSFTYSDQQRLLTITAGDLVTGGLSWTRPVYMGGIQIRRDFGLREDLITMPMPGFEGSAAVPSTVDVYLDNSRIYSAGVEAGPYRISDLPIVTGGGVARVVVQGLQGQETVTELPFYASAQLLRRGLLDFSVEAGFARRGFGSREDSYDAELVASGSVRYGLTDRVTLAAHAEGGAGLVNVGGGATWQLGDRGVVSFAAAGSDSDEGSGVLARIALEFEPGHDVQVFASHQQTVGDYRDLPAVTARMQQLGQIDPADAATRLRNAALPQRRMTQVSVGAPLGDGASVSVSYTGWAEVTGPAHQMLSASYNRRLNHRMNLFVTGYAASGGAGDGRARDDHGVFAGLNVTLGGQRSVSVGARSERSGVSASATFAQSSGNDVGDLNYAVHAETGDNAFQEVSASYRTPVARLWATARHRDGQVHATAQVDGTIVATGGGVFLSDRVGDAFAVVRTGVADVPVLRENRLVGRTNGAGAILVPDLTGYVGNRIEIDVSDLPADVQYEGEATRLIVPPSRGGVVVDFAARPTFGALVALTGADGQPLPLGARVTLNNRADAGVVGYDGETWLTELQPVNWVVVQTPEGQTCRAYFDLQPVQGEQPSIRGVQCR